MSSAYRTELVILAPSVLPEDIIESILAALNPREAARMAQVSKEWHQNAFVRKRLTEAKKIRRRVTRAKKDTKTKNTWFTVNHPSFVYNPENHAVVFIPREENHALRPPPSNIHIHHSKRVRGREKKQLAVALQASLESSASGYGGL